ncbi:MAG: hypothetical protein ACF788_07915 [Novipirellula sp. JB048]
MRSILPLTLFAFTSALWIGCGGRLSDDPPRVVVFGTVTYDGEPIQSGEIRFVPLEGTQAPTAGGLITDGKYRIDQKGGVPVGDFIVRIMGYQSLAASDSDEIPGVPHDDPLAGRKQFLPPRYSEQDSQLTLTTIAGEPMEQNFQLDK